MEAFEYASPKTKEEAVKLLASEWGQSEVLAGGTDLLSLMKDLISTPRRVVNLKAIKELRGIVFKPDTELRLGAMVTFEELMENADVRRHYPALIQAAEGVTSPQIRSLGTVGGDLCQRPRCWYYRAGFGLLAEDQGKPLVPDGENRYHAILGNSGPAYFVNPSSLAPILIALGAKVRLYGAQGSRELGLDQFFVTPTGDAERENALRPNEILTEILVPPPDGAKMAVYEVRQKEALDWPLAAAAVTLRLDGQTVRSARVILGHVAPVPWPSPEAEQALAGKEVNEEVAAEAGKAAVSKATPLSKNAYKVQLARVAVKRAILRAVQGEA
jgi:xanthine dehydrogenase YagS FAD-binding subunit